VLVVWTWRLLARAARDSRTPAGQSLGRGCGWLWPCCPGVRRYLSGVYNHHHRLQCGVGEVRLSISTYASIFHIFYISLKFLSISLALYIYIYIYIYIYTYIYIYIYIYIYAYIDI